MMSLTLLMLLAVVTFTGWAMFMNSRVRALEARQSELLKHMIDLLDHTQQVIDHNRELIKRIDWQADHAADE